MLAVHRAQRNQSYYISFITTTVMMIILLNSDRHDIFRHCFACSVSMGRGSS